MIRILLYQDSTGCLTGFSAKGHSGYAEEGSDIVCSAVSALTITCVNSMESVCGITMNVTGGKDGQLKALLPRLTDTLQIHDAQVLLRSLKQGLSDIAETYPDYVNLSITERRETQ